MNTGLIDQLQADLTEAQYTAAHVRTVLGDEADDARQRGVFAASHRSLSHIVAAPISTLISVFLLGDAASQQQLDQAFPHLGTHGAVQLGLLAPTADQTIFRAALALNPVSIVDAHSESAHDWWLISDLDDQLRKQAAHTHHVMGVGGATRSLIAQLPPGNVTRALDIGTGCGVVALHLALRGDVIATDISARAIRFASANARLNGMQERIEFRRGDLFDPVYQERFDLIASNPPFVITPRVSGEEGPTYEYRDAGMVGDALVEKVIRHAPEHLGEGGLFICLANWEYHWGTNGLSRVEEWCQDPEAGPLAAWIIERDRLSPLQYAETWARDGGLRAGDAEFETVIGGWLEDFAARRVVSLGLGIIRVRRLTSDDAQVIRSERAEGTLAALPGATLAAAFEHAVAVAALPDDTLLDARWLRAEEVAEIRDYRPGEEHPSAITLQSSRGIARRVSADPLLAAAVGACDGELSLGEIAGALAELFQVDEEQTRTSLVHDLRELVWLGMLRTATG